MMKKILHNELFRKIMFTLMMVMLMELGRQIALPAVDTQTSKSVLDSVPFLRNIASVTGGQFEYPTLFSIGLGPYMTGMILFQVLRIMDIDALNKLSEYQVGMIQRLISFLIALLQSLQMIFLIRNHIERSGLVFLGMDYNLIVAFIVLVAGAMIVSWMSDMTVKFGVGGTGVLIIPGIASNMPRLFLRGQGLGSGAINLTPVLITSFAIALLVVLIASIYMNKAERRIRIERPMVQNDFSQSYLPIRVLAAGSIPFMFSTSIFMLPSYLKNLGLGDENLIQKYIAFDNPTGVAIYCGIVIFLGYAFSFMNFRPENTAKRLKKSGDYIPGVIPGDDTQKYLNHRLLLLSTVANVFFLAVIGTPLVVGLFVDGVTNFMFVFSSVLILVTIIDTGMEQIKALYMRTQYNLLER